MGPQISPFTSLQDIVGTNKPGPGSPPFYDWRTYGGRPPGPFDQIPPELSGPLPPTPATPPGSEVVPGPPPPGGTEIPMPPPPPSPPFQPPQSELMNRGKSISPMNQGLVDMGYGFGDAGNGFQYASPHGGVLPPVPAPPVSPVGGATPMPPQPSMPFTPAPKPPTPMQPPSPSPWFGQASQAGINGQRISNVIRRQPAMQPPSSIPNQNQFAAQKPLGYEPVGKKRPGNY